MEGRLAFGVQTLLDVATTLPRIQLLDANANQLLSAIKVARANVVAIWQAHGCSAVAQVDDLHEDFAITLHTTDLCRGFQVRDIAFTAQIFHLEYLK